MGNSEAENNTGERGIVQQRADATLDGMREYAPENLHWKGTEAGGVWGGGGVSCVTVF